MKLMKTKGNKTIEIRYQAREPINEDEEEDQEEEKGEQPEKKKKGEKGEKGEEGSEDQNASTSSDFMVVVKNEDGSGLLFDCNSHEAQLSIYRVAYSKKVDEIANPTNIEKMNQAYQGPDFLSLDEKLQQSFSEYLESLGISDKLLAYVECSAVDKEQRLYMNWLSDVKKFVSDQ